MQKKDRIIRILRVIMPTVAIISLIVIPPLDLIPPMIAPLPDYGLDGIIVYVDQPDKSPAFYAAGCVESTQILTLT